MDQLIVDYETKFKVGNAGIYRTVKNSLWKFRPNKKLRFSDIDFRFLSNYETHLYKNNLTGNGISLYMRTIRATYNKAIKFNVTDPSFYPFSNQSNPNGYKISELETDTQKRAISLTEIRIIEITETLPLTSLHDAKQYFLFSFYTRGMNFTDMSNLKQSNIQGNRINYTRAKTRHKQRFVVEIMKPVKDILSYFETHPEKGNYLLPVLNDKVYKTPKQQKTRIQTVLKLVNRKLKDLAELAGIEAGLTTYVARHSWATIQKEMGTPTAAIGDGLGHTNSETTERYLRKFENTYLDDINRKLLE
jgi:site-specific recombinase XerD